MGICSEVKGWVYFLVFGPLHVKVDQLCCAHSQSEPPRNGLMEAERIYSTCLWFVLEAEDGKKSCLSYASNMLQRNNIHCYSKHENTK